MSKVITTIATVALKSVFNTPLHYQMESHSQFLQDNNFATLLHKVLNIGITRNQSPILKKYCQYHTNAYFKQQWLAEREMIPPLFPAMIPSLAPACTATAMRGKLG